jgi:hypothetical protein
MVSISRWQSCSAHGIVPLCMLQCM